MYKVLIFGMTENPGGVESFLRNYIQEMASGNIQFDFLCNFHCDMAYEAEMKSKGCRVFHITARSQNIRKYHRELRRFFESYASEYDCIWVNVSSLANIDYLKLAKRFQIPKRIIHSHNSQNMDSWLRGLLHRWNRLRVSLWATDFWACSVEAGKWFYTKKLVKKCVIIHNAIPVEKMQFLEEQRAQCRSLMGAEDVYIVGNIGRLHFQKNQSFLLKAFAAAVSGYPGMVLLFVGQGEDEEKLKKLSGELKLEGKVYFAGVQSDISRWLSAMDVFVFPSLFEGTPIAALEAQANGVPVLASDTALREECIVNPNCRILSLKDPVDRWAEAILEMARCSERLPDDRIRQNFKEKGYDIHTEVDRVEQLLHSREKQ